MPSLVAAAALAAIASWSPLDGWQAELKRQCPDRPPLEARALNAALQAFEQTLPQVARTEIDETRAADCSAAHDAMSAACEASAVVGVLASQGRLTQAVAFACRPPKG